MRIEVEIGDGSGLTATPNPRPQTRTGRKWARPAVYSAARPAAPVRCRAACARRPTRPSPAPPTTQSAVRCAGVREIAVRRREGRGEGHAKHAHGRGGRRHGGSLLYCAGSDEEENAAGTKPSNHCGRGRERHLRVLRFAQPQLGDDLVHAGGLLSDVHLVRQPQQRHEVQRLPHGQAGATHTCGHHGGHGAVGMSARTGSSADGGRDNESTWIRGDPPPARWP